MKDNKKEIKIEGIGNSLITTCPVCGFSFRTYDPKTRKKINKCPMCGYELPHENDIFKKKFF